MSSIIECISHLGSFHCLRERKWIRTRKGFAGKGRGGQKAIHNGENRRIFYREPKLAGVHHLKNVILKINRIHWTLNTINDKWHLKWDYSVSEFLLDVLLLIEAIQQREEEEKEEKGYEKNEHTTHPVLRLFEDSNWSKSHKIHGKSLVLFMMAFGWRFRWRSFNVTCSSSYKNNYYCNLSDILFYLSSLCISFHPFHCSFKLFGCYVDCFNLWEQHYLAATNDFAMQKNREYFLASSLVTFMTFFKNILVSLIVEQPDLCSESGD